MKLFDASGQFSIEIVYSLPQPYMLQLSVSRIFESGQNLNRLNRSPDALFCTMRNRVKCLFQFLRAYSIPFGRPDCGR